MNANAQSINAEFDTQSIELIDAITAMDAASQTGNAAIGDAIRNGRAMLEKLGTGNRQLVAGIAALLDAIQCAAEDAANEVNCRAESVGCNFA